MKHIKHWLATMAVLLCSVTANAHDFEVGGIYYNITSEEDLTVQVTFRGDAYDSYANEYNGAVSIPSTVTYNSITYNVTSIGDKAFRYCSSLTSITIPESVTSIGGSVFSGCSSLTTINIPEGVTSIGAGAFYDCSSLTSINIPEGVTSIGSDAFHGCSGLTAITFPENSQLTSIGDYVFSGCSGLTVVTLPESVTSIGDGTFSGCSSLTSITLSEELTKIDMSAFSNCSSLTAITIPEGVTSIEYRAFSDCSSLTSISFPENSQLTSIGERAFLKCRSLTTITIPEGVTEIGDYAFSGCNGLTDITIPKSVTSIGERAFELCSGKLVVNCNIPSGWVYYGGAFYSSSFTNVTIGDGVTNIGSYAFYDCWRLTTVTIPKSVTRIESDAFRGCSGLTAITCHAVTPPTISGSYTFSSVDKSIPVYVPAGSIKAYKAAEQWEDFTNIVSMVAPITINQYGSGTYCSEYALDFSEVEGLKAYAATGYDTETGVVTLTRVMTAKAGMGLFVKGEPGDYVVPTLESTSFNTLNMLVGTLEDVIVNGTDGLYTNYKYAAPDGEPLFYQFADGSTQKAGRAYLQIPTSWLTTTTAKSISYRFDDGETTDIENSEITTPNSEFIYDLYGRRVENPVKGGVYIVKGKKIVY